VGVSEGTTCSAWVRLTCGLKRLLLYVGAERAQLYLMHTTVAALIEFFLLRPLPGVK
jgi:hypothetical protein